VFGGDEIFVLGFFEVEFGETEDDVGRPARVVRILLEEGLVHLDGLDAPLALLLLLGLRLTVVARRDLLAPLLVVAPHDVIDRGAVVARPIEEALVLLLHLLDDLGGWARGGRWGRGRDGLLPGLTGLRGGV